jgi:hypothetical protein
MRMKMPLLTRRPWQFAVIVSLSCVGGCNLLNNATAPTAAALTEVFAGTLAPQGANIFMFTVAQAGAVTVTLTALSPANTVGVGLGIGTPSGTTACTLTTSTPNAIAGSLAAIRLNEAAGSFCVKIYDVGTLSTSSTFTISVSHL